MQPIGMFHDRWESTAVQVCLLTVLILGFGASGIANDVERRFRADAPKAWEEYVELLERLQGELRGTTTVRGKRTGEFVWRFKQCADHKLVQYTLQDLADGSYEEQVFGTNSRYSFELLKRASDHPWLLLNVRERDERVSDPSVREFEAASFRLRTALQIGWEKDVLDLVEQPTFRITAAEELDGHLMVIKFQNLHDWNTEPFFPIQVGNLVLNPARMWTVQSAIVRAKFANGEYEAHIENEFSASDPADPIPVRSVMNVFALGTRGDSPAMTHDVVFDFVLPNDVPAPTEFTVSAYGLPEPFDDVEEASNGLFAWTMLAGIGCLMLAGSIAWWRRRAGR